MAVVAALVSALLYGTASVLQHSAAEQAPDHRSLRPGLLVMLAARPLWVLGIVADLGAFGFQFVALDHGSVALVQPILVTGLLFALPVGAALGHRRFSRREWVSALFVVAGLALFLVVASPGGGRNDATGLAWGVAAIAVFVPTGLIIVAVRLWRGPWRAAALAVAAGGVMGLVAALIKAVAGDVHLGLATTFTSWQLYALGACAGVALLVIQSAFQAGPLSWSLPTLTVMETVAGVTVGVLLFGEELSGSAWGIVAEVIGMAAIAVGVFRLGSLPVEAHPASSS